MKASIEIGFAFPNLCIRDDKGMSVVTMPVDKYSINSGVNMISFYRTISIDGIAKRREIDMFVACVPVASIPADELVKLPQRED